MSGTAVTPEPGQPDNTEPAAETAEPATTGQPADTAPEPMGMAGHTGDARQTEPLSVVARPEQLAGEAQAPASRPRRKLFLLIGVPAVALASLAAFGACQLLSRSVPVEQINMAISPARVGQTQTTEVWLIRADGSDSRKLTDNNAYDGEPDLYRDRRVTFVSTRDGNYEIYVMEADGSAVKRLTDNLAADSTPRWSPDGRRIVFTSERDGNREIYVMKADGSDVRRLTDSPGFDGEPTWSPDGKRLAFVSERDRNKEIYVMDDDGTDTRRVTNNPKADQSPSWSPADKNVLAFSSERAGTASIYLMTPEGEDIKRLTAEGDGAPFWSPEGDHILFWTGRGLSGGAQEVWVMTKAGTEQRKLTDFNGARCWPSCEP